MFTSAVQQSESAIMFIMYSLFFKFPSPFLISFPSLVYTLPQSIYWSSLWYPIGSCYLFYKCVCTSLSVVSDSLWLHGLYVARQAPLSSKFFKQEYWSELPFPSSEDLSDPGVEPRSPALQVNSFTIWTIREDHFIHSSVYMSSPIFQFIPPCSPLDIHLLFSTLRGTEFNL